MGTIRGYDTLARLMSLTPIEELGILVEAPWHAVNYEPKALPELATAALVQSRLAERLTPDDILAWVLDQRDLPEQADPGATFGQPPITLYRGRRFYIDALFWVDGTTSIHQHAFSGAFCVLAGSSIETRFSFDCERGFDGHFEIGRLGSLSTELLRLGDVRAIYPGRANIHSLFHLERPSVTIVVRNYRDPQVGVQFDYARPGIAHDRFFQDSFRDKLLQLSKMMRTIEYSDFEALIGTVIARSDLHTAYRIIKECTDIPDRDLVDRLLSRIHDADAAEIFGRSFQETRNNAFLHSRRRLVKDPDLRFFLGLLLNANDRAEVFKLVRSRNGEDVPARIVAKWLRSLSGVSAKLQLGGTAWEPNLLGLPAIDDRLEAALELCLSGHERADNQPIQDVLERLRTIPTLACLWR
jgi:hypothetical protein